MFKRKSYSIYEKLFLKKEKKKEERSRSEI